MWVSVWPVEEGRPEAPGTGALRSEPIRASRRAAASAAMVDVRIEKGRKRGERGEEA